MRELVCGIHRRVSDRTRRAAESLKYRDFLTVMLILKERNKFADNWIYIHDPRVKVGRVQNFKSWSPEMVPDPDKACYGLEYFCFEGDGLWESRDEDLIALAKRELIQIGLARKATLSTGPSFARRKRIRFTMTITRCTSPRFARNWTRNIQICIWSAATECTSTTTRITP